MFKYSYKWCRTNISIQTAAALSVFILAMVHYPEVMRRAQAQIDTVVGRDRLPTFGDRERLPYIEAIIKEVQRWRPVGPIGLPRCTTQVRQHMILDIEPWSHSRQRTTGTRVTSFRKASIVRTLWSKIYSCLYRHHSDHEHLVSTSLGLRRMSIIGIFIGP